MSVSDQVRRVAADLFQVPLDRILLESSPETLEQWDSVQHLNLVLAIENEFDLQLEPEQIDNMKSIGQIVSLIEASR